MSEISYWEEKFVRQYIVKNRRDRYLTFLKGKKHRQKVLNKLNHNLDFHPHLGKVLMSSTKSEEGLSALLQSKHVSGVCYLIADGNDWDGKELTLELGVNELLGNELGAVLICPPKPIAIYKEEDIGRLFLLSDQ